MTEQAEPLLSLRGVGKRFGAVQALSDVDFGVSRGEVVALVGDNGAGKSTLIKVIAGVLRPYGGEIAFDGRPVSIDGPADATALGIATVYQDLALAGWWAGLGRRASAGELGSLPVVIGLLAVNQSSGSGDLLLNAIAAAVIGGTSLFRARGTAGLGPGDGAWTALLLGQRFRMEDDDTATRKPMLS